MPRARINVGNHLAWGKLVKSWATGRNYIDHVGDDQNPIPPAEQIPPSFPKPNSFKDFVDQCNRAGVGLFFEDGQNTPVDPNLDMGFVLLQSTSDLAVLRLPAKDKI